VPLEKTAIFEMVAEVLGAPGVNRYGIPPQDFVDAILKLRE
jgi:hypothetical protein